MICEAGVVELASTGLYSSSVLRCVTTPRVRVSFARVHLTVYIIASSKDKEKHDWY